MQNVLCDSCGKSISINLKEKKHGQGVVEAFFNCPHCDKRYTAYVTNAIVRRKQREIRTLYESLSTITDVQKYQDTQRVIEEKKRELQPLMSELKGKYGK